MSRNIVFEGWLTKSPPTKRIWRAKWRKRWFALRQSGELPGQYFLDYYADRNYRRLKGTINLDLCEQVDAGLHVKRGNGTLDPKIRGSVFTIRTQSRTYHLEADCEEDMGRWVDAICKVCCLRSTEDTTEGFGTYTQNSSEMDTNVHEGTDTPYIPISQCITGTKMQADLHPFILDSNNRLLFDRTSKSNQMYKSQQHINHNADFSENESNNSEDECHSLNASHSVMDSWTAARSFTKLQISPHADIETNGPPVPPRPRKTLIRPQSRTQREAFYGPRTREPCDMNHGPPMFGGRAPRRNSPVQLHARINEEDEEMSPQHSRIYSNLLTMPPAVDRNLKPRSGYAGQMHNVNVAVGGAPPSDANPDLQYLDLTLHTSKPPNKPAEVEKALEPAKMTVEDDHPDYTTVDLVKTEALFTTRQDAEASRNIQTDSQKA